MTNILYVLLDSMKNYIICIIYYTIKYKHYINYVYIEVINLNNYISKKYFLLTLLWFIF